MDINDLLIDGEEELSLAGQAVHLQEPLCTLHAMSFVYHEPRPACWSEPCMPCCATSPVRMVLCRGGGGFRRVARFACSWAACSHMQQAPSVGTQACHDMLPLTSTRHLPTCMHGRAPHLQAMRSSEASWSRCCRISCLFSFPFFRPMGCMQPCSKLMLYCCCKM